MFNKAIKILKKYHAVVDSETVDAYLEADMPEDKQSQTALLQELHEAGYNSLVAPDNSIIITGNGKPDA